jgi:hypothetical protein
MKILVLRCMLPMATFQGQEEEDSSMSPSIAISYILSVTTILGPLVEYS